MISIEEQELKDDIRFQVGCRMDRVSEEVNRSLQEDSNWIYTSIYIFQVVGVLQDLNFVAQNGR